MLPKNEHLKVAMYINTILGVWPVITNLKLREYYNIYSKVVFVYFILFIIRAYIKLYYILADDILDKSEIFANLATTLLCSITILRVFALKTSRILNIINFIIRAEDRIKSTGTFSEIKIYNFFAYQSKVSNTFFLVCLFFGKFTNLYIFWPIFTNPKYIRNIYCTIF